MTEDELTRKRSDSVRAYYRSTVAREWGIRVDERMKTLRMKEADLARQAGTTPQTIHKVRKGELMPREYLRVMIALALAADPGDLFPAPSRERLLEAVPAA